jgi:hypothetical protein
MNVTHCVSFDQSLEGLLPPGTQPISWLDPAAVYRLSQRLGLLQRLRNHIIPHHFSLFFLPVWKAVPLEWSEPLDIAFLYHVSGCGFAYISTFLARLAALQQFDLTPQFRQRAAEEIRTVQPITGQFPEFSNPWHR